MAMLILASRSPVRKALLSGAGLTFETRPADVNERALEAKLAGDGGAAVAMGLAEVKAQVAPGAVVIGADQVLEFEGRLLHKPETMAAARSQLLELRGKTHHLHAGVALAVGGRVVWSHVESAELTMRKFADDELDAVLALEGERALGSVGGYRLEGPSIRLFERVAGDYFSILGLPLLPLLQALRVHAPQVFEGFT
jgi:septum formation protein